MDVQIMYNLSPDQSIISDLEENVEVVDNTNIKQSFQSVQAPNLFKNESPQQFCQPSLETPISIKIQKQIPQNPQTKKWQYSQKENINTQHKTITRQRSESRDKLQQTKSKMHSQYSTFQSDLIELDLPGLISQIAQKRRNSNMNKGCIMRQSIQCSNQVVRVPGKIVNQRQLKSQSLQRRDEKRGKTN